MPVLDGYEATRRIRAAHDGSETVPIPIVAVTAHALIGEREKALAAGMDDYLAKPVGLVALKQLLERWLPGAGQPAPKSGPPGGETAPEAVSLDPQIERSATVKRLFLRHVPDQIEKIGAAIAAGEKDSLKRAAHKLKGGTSAVGALRMTELCRYLEAAPADADSAFLSLKEEFSRVKGLLEAELAA